MKNYIIFRRKLNDPEDIEKLKEIKNKIKGLDLLEYNNYYDIDYLIKREKERKKIFAPKINNSKLNKYIEQIKEQCLMFEKKYLRGRFTMEKRKIENSH